VEPPPPDPSPGGGALVPEFLPGELEELYEDLATATRAHRRVWRENVDWVVRRASAFASDEGERERRRRETTSHPQVVQAMELVGRGVSLALAEAEEAEKLDGELLADGLGIASWTLGDPPGSVPSADRVKLLSDPRVRYLVRYYTPAVAVA